MRVLAIVIVAACSAPSKPAPAPAPPPVTPPPASIDAAAAAVGAPRGGACIPFGSPQGTCADGLTCFPAPGGYCTSFCGATGTACDDGVCMETGRGGAACAKSCTADADCRTGEGYICDPVWHACSMPGMAAPKAPACAAKTIDKHAFGAAEAVTSDATPGVYQFEPSSAIADDGAVVSVFTTGAAMGEPNEARVAVIGKSVHETALPKDREHAFDAWITRDAHGVLHAVWLAFDGPGAPEKDMEIAYTTSSDGGATWSAVRAVHDPDDCPDAMRGCLDKPMIAAGAGKRLYVAYATEADGREGLRMRASDDGGATFGPSAAVMDASYSDLAIGGNGAIHVVGANGSPKSGAFGAVGQTIDYVVSKDGGKTFSKVVHVNGDDESIPFFFVNPGVEVDDKRHTVYVTYARGATDAAWDIVLAASKDGGKTWTRTVVNDDGHCAAHMVPNAAIDPATGRVHVTWLDDRDGHGALGYAVCEPGGAKCAKNERASDDPFAAFSFVRHAGPWMGEYASLVVDPKRHALHAVWTQPVATPRGPASRVFHAAAKL
jgi:hypothetical protein